jgi:hypothetical protein
MKELPNNKCFPSSSEKISENDNKTEAQKQIYVPQIIHYHYSYYLFALNYNRSENPQIRP